MSLKDLLKESLNLEKDGVYKVDVKDSFSFFNTDNTHEELVLSVFKDFQLDGRSVSVEVSTDKGRSGGGRRSGGRGRDDRGRGGDRGRRGDRGRDRGRSENRRGDRDGGKSDNRFGGGSKDGFKKRRGVSGDDKPKFSGKRRGGGDKPDSKGTGGKRRRRV